MKNRAFLAWCRDETSVIHYFKIAAYETYKTSRIYCQKVNLLHYHNTIPEVISGR